MADQGEAQLEKVDRKRGEAICPISFFILKVKVKHDKCFPFESVLSFHLVSTAMVLKPVNALASL